MKKLAAVLIRPDPHYRADAFVNGLKNLGYSVNNDVARCDLLVCWNRNSSKGRIAEAVQKRGGRVLVAENSYLGNNFCGERTYSISENEHSGSGKWPFVDRYRWHTFGYPLLDPITPNSKNVLILAQRGIGSATTAQPYNYVDKMRAALAPHLTTRVRRHPGQKEVVQLEDDLKGSCAVATWASGAAVRAVAMGYPCYYGLANWILATCSTPLWAVTTPPSLDVAARKLAFERLAWCQWRISEIQSGFAFDTLLKG